jgi:3-phenylpropionate/trans-cinnamate dioxygenase ferredoxin reductase subunit
MLGITTPYDKVPYFYSDQYELGMEYRGWAPTYEQVVFRGDPSSGEFIVFWLGDGIVRAAMNANVWDEGDNLERLLLGRATPDQGALADPDTDLADLAGAAA